ncbi:MAG: zinc ribbon domain-containing protein [Bryobacterales bacterium]|nr:zinc ribbon domain-containing protein [Bryobacterales bacterium]
MPIYEYRCLHCGRKFEKIRRVTERDRPAECPECKSEDSVPQISGFATGSCGGSGGHGRGRFT